MGQAVAKLIVNAGGLGTSPAHASIIFQPDSPVTENKSVPIYNNKYIPLVKCVIDTTSVCMHSKAGMLSMFFGEERKLVIQNENDVSLAQRSIRYHIAVVLDYENTQKQM